MASTSSQSSVRTRKSSDSRLTDYVGVGKTLIPSEVPTVRSVIQLGIFLKETEFNEKERSKNTITTKELCQKLAPLVIKQWQKSNAQFKQPVIISEYALERKITGFGTKLLKLVMVNARRMKRMHLKKA